MSAQTSDESRRMFASILLDSLPPQILATAIIKACEHFAYTKPEISQRILANSWCYLVPCIKEVLKDKPLGRIAASALIIENYFRHRGNWREMYEGLLDDVPVDRQLAEMSVKSIFDMLVEKMSQEENKQK